MSIVVPETSEARRGQFYTGIVVAMAVVLLTVTYQGSIRSMVHTWSNMEEYSHGFFIPIISAFLVFQRKDRLEKIEFNGSWLGVLVVAVGSLLYLSGALATVSTMNHYAFVITVWGMFLTFMGWRGFRAIWIAAVMLVFMVKLPTFVYQNLFAQLQLISSEIGVWVIRLFGISVFLDGNVIYLGSMKLQVGDACSGLRYLFPLMAVGASIAAFYKAAMWKRWLIFLSSIPITILMTSFRVGIIGVTVDYLGEEEANGFLHGFEGRAVFVAAFAALLAAIWLVTRLTGDQRPFREVFAIDLPAGSNSHATVKRRPVPKAFYASILLLPLTFAGAASLQSFKHVIPKRQYLDNFPLVIGEWRAEREQMEQQYIDVLHFDDYLLADYRNPQGSEINLYIAWYDKQGAGEGTVHSPRSCVQGDGWQIKRLTQEHIEGIGIVNQPLEVNRVLIAKGNRNALVYYWMQQRGRVITNEYAAKWWIFWDGLTRNRTDGSLVRLTATLDPGVTVEEAEAQLKAFTRAILPKLPRFIPN